jgi:hypothetical protein
MTGLARQAGLDCRVDAGAMIGLTPEGGRLYEAGCADAEGAWLERTAGGGWRITDCLTVVARGGACRFTTEAESLAAFETRLSEAGETGCRPARLRHMGQGPSGPLYEVGCRGEGDGVVARFNADGRIGEVLPCEAAKHIGGGCILPR